VSFAIDPIRWISGAEHDHAVESVVGYVSRFTGAWFESVAGRTDPNQVTGEDIVAVSTLGTKVPAAATAWILGEGRPLITPLLSQVGTDPIWRQDEAVLVDPGSPLNRLWALLRSDACGWPDGEEGAKETAVTTGKLLAAKRPHLVPIFDEHVSMALGHRYGTYTQCWRTALLDDTTRTAAADLRVAAAEQNELAGGLSLLRVLGITIWMRQHGWMKVPPMHRPGWVAPVSRRERVAS